MKSSVKNKRYLRCEALNMAIRIAEMASSRKNVDIDANVVLDVATMFADFIVDGKANNIAKVSR